MLLSACWLMSACTAGPEIRVEQEAPAATSLAEGRRFLEQGRAAEAVAVFRRRLRKEGSSLTALNGLAIAYGELGRPELAAEMFARALAMAPDDAATLNNIGFAALRRADLPLARLYLERARRRGDGVDQVEGNLARLAVLESNDFKRPSRSVLRPAALHGRGERAVSPLRLAMPKTGVERPAGPTEPSRRGQTRPSSIMIDFISVNDPFAQPSERAMPR